MSFGTAFAFKWCRINTAWLPFADAASADLPMQRLLRLSLFQVSVGMAAVLLTGTLNRVMIVEMNIPASLVAIMVALPLVFAPLRAVIGFKSDNHRSLLGWRRVPYIWFGTLLQFGGFAIMPFALLIMSGDTTGPIVVGEIAAALAFLLVGAGMHTTQTAGLALATDLASEDSRPRVVALLYVMLLAGMLIAALVIGALLADFNALRLIEVIQGVAALTMALNIIALWKQEARDPLRTAPDAPRSDFKAAWADFVGTGRNARLLVAVGLGAAAFSMQDVLLEPYGGEVLGLSVGGTTLLTALWAAGMLAGFGASARRLAIGTDPARLAGTGAVVGIAAFALIILSAPLAATGLLGTGIGLVGFGSGLFSVGTLIAVMNTADTSKSGIALGAWGAVQASCAGGAIALGGILRDTVATMADAGVLGAALTGPAVGYGFVYHFEILLLFATLVALGPLARHAPWPAQAKFGLSEFPT